MSKQGPAIDREFERGLAALINSGEPEVLQGGKKGVEKESLRITPQGDIATTAHPRALGSALTSSNITTDYSEALLEFVTPTFRSSWELLQYLCDVHQFAYQHLDDELLWATSMPCKLQGDESIPIAEYGSSNIGRMKTVYRRGLGIRYGRIMQAISGVHYNYSFPDRFWEAWRDIRGSRANDQDFISDNYFRLLRNYRRHGWIVLYLFGVSPAVCGSFLQGRDFHLPELMAGTAFEPYATSLRMSDLGYRNRNQAGLKVSVNSLDEYVRDLTRAISTPHPDYQQLGVKVNGDYRQLNANVLQIENEYYSFIRPKRVARTGERPTVALQRAGVEYVEVRALDVSAYDPVGVNQNKLRFLEVFLAFCVLRDSPFIDAAEQDALDANHLTVAHRGREPGLLLGRAGRKVALRDWGHEIIDSMQGVAEILDRGDAARPYATALAIQKAKLDDVALTPSARLLAEMRSSGESFFEVSLRMSRLHKDYFLALYPPNTQRLAEFKAGAAESLAAQQAIEAGDTIGFDEYLAAYFQD